MMKNDNRLIHFCLIAGMTLSTQVFADDVKPMDTKTPSNNISNYGELDALRSQNALLTEQLKKAELESKLLGTRQTQSASSGPSAFGTLSSPKIKASSNSYIDRSARIQLVTGVGSKLTATIQSYDGSNTLARVGMSIPNLGIVKSIKSDEVIVSNGKEIYSVPFAAESAMNASQNAQSYPMTQNGGVMVPPMSAPAGMN
jgi:type IV pilus biogenesis protein PilP